MATKHCGVVAFMLLLLPGVLPGGERAVGATAPKLVVYPAPAGEKASGDYTLQVNGHPVFVYTATVLHGGPASFAYFDFAGSVDVKVTATRQVDKAVVRPSSYGITPAVAGNPISFSLAQSRYVSVELNGSFERPLLLFANPLEVDPPKPDDPNVLYFGPGLHEIATTRIESNKTVYIAGGAVVRGKILPGEKVVQERNWAGNKVYENLICINKAKNVTVRGRGILDMSTLPWHSKCPISIADCSDVLVEGIIIKDSACWCTPVFNCTRATYRNLKEVCGRENSDGINIVNSQDVLVEHCFLRNNDDEICVKTTAPPPAPESKNITVRDCVVWNDRAYGIGITYETRADISAVLFKDCDIIHDHGIGSLAVHMSDGATASDVRFEDIRLEDTRNRVVRFWIGKDFWGHDKERGHLRNVLLKNVSVTGGPFAPSELTGADATHLIEDVTFDNFRVRGKGIPNLAAGRIRANQHTKGIKFVNAAAESVETITYPGGLVGHWKLDDGSGASAADSSPGGCQGKLVNLDAKEAWVAGRLGGALEFDGDRGYVELANSSALQDVQEGNYTLSAWFKPANTPPGTGNAYNGAYAIIMKKGFHEGLMYNSENKFELCHWLAGDKGTGATTAGTFQPGRFYHVAGVVDKANGAAHIYINGKLEGSGAFDGNAEVRPYGEDIWRIGTANNNTREGYAWPANGVIDDVRIYNRALGAEEIGNLAGGR